MSSVTPLKLPVIDFSKEDLKPGTSYWSSVRAEVRQALEQYGCFEAVYDKVPLESHKAIFGALEELFDLPLEAKIQNTSNDIHSGYGYVGPSPDSPLYEGMGIDKPVLERVRSFTNLMWPEGNASFCEIVHSYTNRVSEFEHIVKKMVFESLGVEKYYDSHVESTSYLLRVMKYKVPEKNETKPALKTHTDADFITILKQNQVSGLEVQTKHGEWISVTPSAASFTVMSGEEFLAWSNGRLHTPRHRVTMGGDDERYSIALFSYSRDIIQVPEELVDEDHPLLFKPFDHLGLLGFYFTEEGQKAESLVKAYCGV